MPVLPIPHPMDEVRGDKMFWRQLNSRFGYGQIRNLGSYHFSYCDLRLAIVLLYVMLLDSIT